MPTRKQKVLRLLGIEYKVHQRSGQPLTVEYRRGRWGLKVLYRKYNMTEYRFLTNRSPRRSWFCWLVFCPPHLSTSRYLRVILPWFEAHLELLPGKESRWHK